MYNCNYSTNLPAPYPGSQQLMQPGTALFGNPGHNQFSFPPCWQARFPPRPIAAQLPAHTPTPCMPFPAPSLPRSRLQGEHPSIPLGTVLSTFTTQRACEYSRAAHSAANKHSHEYGLGHLGSNITPVNKLHQLEGRLNTTKSAVVG